MFIVLFELIDIILLYFIIGNKRLTEVEESFFGIFFILLGIAVPLFYFLSI